MSEIIYLRMKKNIELNEKQAVLLGDIAFMATGSVSVPKDELAEVVIYQITEQDANIVVIDRFLIITHLNKAYPNMEIQFVGPVQSIIRIEKVQKKASVVLTIGIWILLFIGTATTIMNFHYDVSMQEVQVQLHYLLTGEENEHPLWIQVPYSFGLGIGMLLFFNHWFKKRFNEEPSPLEVEIFKYEESLEEYVSHYENRLNDPKYRR